MDSLTKKGVEQGWTARSILIDNLTKPSGGGS